MSGFVKPYRSEITAEERAQRVVAKVSIGRSATMFLSDIEAYLVERELPSTWAQMVAELIDFSGWSLEYATTSLAAAASWGRE